MKIPVYKPSLVGNEKKYVNECLDTTWISSRGDFVSKFETAFQNYVGGAHAVSVCNGTVALHLAMIALGVGKGDEVLVPSLTYIAPVNMILVCGATPVFIDSDPKTWCISPQDAKKKITKKTKAILAVHLYGHACNMPELKKLCANHDLWLIEDCAEAVGTKYDHQHVGSFGDVSTFSFFGNKTITTGEGGMVCSPKSEIRDKIYHLKTQAVSPSMEYYHDDVGFNYRMTNICAAIGLGQIEHIDQILLRKKQIAHWYNEELKGLPVSMHSEEKGTTHSFWMCSLLVDRAEQHDPLRVWLKDKGIETRPVFLPAHKMPYLNNNGSLPVAENISARGMNLPSYPALEHKDVKEIAGSVRKFFSR
jgi:perosamine synthetase